MLLVIGTRSTGLLVYNSLDRKNLVYAIYTISRRNRKEETAGEYICNKNCQPMQL